MPDSPIRKLAPFATAAKEAGKHVIHLNIGQPDIETPQVALDAVRNDSRTVIEYSPSEGFASYREGLAAYYRSVDIEVKAEDVLVTTGGSEALVFAFMSCLNPGDEVIIPEPFYANYNGFAQMAGVRVVPVTAHIDEGFALPPIEDFAAKINDKTKAILLCNPGNPTGTVYAPEALDALAKLVKDNDLYLFADEVYREFCYDGAKPKSSSSGGKDAEDEKSDDDGEEPEPLTEEQLAAAENEMNEELSKLVGMTSVKENMRKLCKQLSLDIKRRQGGLQTLDSIRHMMFTGNPGVGKTTVSRLVAKLYKQLGVSSKDHVIEVQKGDLVAGYVNQTAMKTAKKIKEARGGILFVDEAYQLTQALQRGQSDFSGEAIDEMMKVMNESGRKAVTFVFAGYQKEMGEFIQYNAGLESRIKYKFHFADYTVPELVTITNIKLKAKGYKLAPDAQTAMPGIIDKGTDAVLRSKYNGRLTDNLIQWAGDEMNTRLSLDADGDQLITLTKSDLATAIGRFATARPPVKKDPALLGGEQVESQLSSHSYRTIPTHTSY